MKQKFLLLIALLVSGSLLFTACDETLDTDTQSAQDNAKAEGVMSDVFGLVSGNAEGSTKSGEDITCYTAELTGTVEARTLTITFPEAGCPDENGVVHKGKIIGTFTGRWFIPGSKVEITFENYERNDEVLNGTITGVYKENLKEGDKIYPIHEITTTSMELVLTDGKSIKWTATRTLKWLSGYFTKSRSDNQVLINSELNGQNVNGDTFSSTGTDLLHKFPCKLFVSGTIELNKADGSTSAIDFGDGECDGKFSVTQNGVTVELNI